MSGRQNGTSRTIRILTTACIALLLGIGDCRLIGNDKNISGRSGNDSTFDSIMLQAADSIRNKRAERDSLKRSDTTKRKNSQRRIPPQRDFLGEDVPRNLE